MEIGPVRREQPEQAPREAENRKREVVSPSQPSSDRVEISDAARKRLAELADAARRELPAIEHAEKLARLNDIRARIRSGYYDQPEVKRRIADRLADELGKAMEDNNEIEEEP